MRKIITALLSVLCAGTLLSGCALLPDQAGSSSSSSSSSPLGPFQSTSSSSSVSDETSDDTTSSDETSSDTTSEDSTSSDTTTDSESSGSASADSSSDVDSSDSSSPEESSSADESTDTDSSETSSSTADSSNTASSDESASTGPSDTTPDDTTSSDETSSDTTPEDATSSDESTDESTSSNASSSEDTSSDESSSDSTLDSSSSIPSTSTPEESSSSSSTTVDTQTEEILKAAYALKNEEWLYNITLTGVVTNVQKRSSGDICLTMVVGGFTQYPIYCYWLQDADFVEVGDTITVFGDIKNYQGTIEFFKPSLEDINSGDDTPEQGDYLFTDFKDEEKELFLDRFGEVIPFVPNNEYYVDEYDYYDEVGLNFYTFDNTRSEFNAYLNKFSSYTNDGTNTDEDGNVWYFFSKANYFVDLTYYYDSDYSSYLIDVYAYVLDDYNWDDDWDDNWGDEESSGNGGNSGDNTQDVELLTNDGKGLPTSVNGVYDVDFTAGKYVQNVAQQGYYLDGCPTVGSPNVLVIPVEFSDSLASQKGYTIANINKAFNGGAGEVDYLSVHDYYYTSSYGKLDVQFTVLDSWFKPSKNSSYYLSQTMDYYGYEIECGDQIIINEFLSAYNSKMDFSQFDSDNNGTIDAIILINTLEIDSDVTMQWAYRYWNIYTDSNDEYYTYDGVYANDYLWASYQFLFEDKNGGFDNKSALNTYTYIHEFGHVLGADDYYDTSYTSSPMDGHDIMDSETGDHNPYSKFNYGWLTSARLIVAEDTVSVSLDSFNQNGDAIIIANNWDATLGAYQEYFIVIYYKNEGLNEGYGYFDEEGIIVYHVNASLYVETIDGVTYYDVYNNNTDVNDPDGYGTENNLIELVENGNGYVFTQGDSLSANTRLDNGEKIAYTFTVDTITKDSATLTFRKNA